MIKNSKQSWELGQSVKIGFLSNLMVIGKLATPGDYAPDKYLLIRGEQFYEFVPHNGLHKVSGEEAVEFVCQSDRQQKAAEAKAVDAAAAAIHAAKVRASILKDRA